MPGPLRPVSRPAPQPVIARGATFGKGWRDVKGCASQESACMAGRVKMRQNDQHVTIVMATRNGEAHLPEQLASIAAQSHPSWSLFVSDDGSTDRTREILDAFGKRHPVSLVEGPGRGAAANFLSALCHPDLAPGITALADQDDVWLKGKLARGLRRMAAAERKMGGAQPHAPLPVIYAGESMLADGALNTLSQSKSGRTRPGFAPSLAQNLFAGHSIMLNAPALDLVRRSGVPERVSWHDWWLYQLIAGCGGALALDPTPVVIYRQHGGNALGGARGTAAGKRRLAMLLSGEWGRMMQDHALALKAREALLTRDARKTLDGFLDAPEFGPARILALRRLGIRRSSRIGDAALAAAAAFGRI
ncbi:glycosyltransferase [Paracoccus sp. IB05]|uniref:glycosyltransferase n=1 Tax=Paracoccus sp. IB05 TaxID=2779367 RepID=UPI0018E77945|nr:glycosyltransferase [Paracoccus sp. IB05]MBJ2151030.1 glycosyltransferase [Paracoccus sp. IB05]